MGKGKGAAILHSLDIVWMSGGDHPHLGIFNMFVSIFQAVIDLFDPYVMKTKSVYFYHTHSLDN